MRNAQTFLRMEMPPLRMGDVLFVDGDASFAGGERAFYGWKRRCADVRAGTQAPPLPFLVWFRVPRLPEETLPINKRAGWLVANSSPTSKTQKGCVAEGFDGGW